MFLSLRRIMQQDASSMPQEKAQEMEKNRSLSIRTVYLYVATLVGLGLIIAGGVQAFELILKSTVLTQADAEERLWAQQPPVPYALDVVKEAPGSLETTAEQQATIERWLADYERWSEQQEQLDVVAARRERQAATALALLFVGIPVYLYHWLTIRRELGRVRIQDSTADG
jgi:hypothetical protein